VDVNRSYLRHAKRRHPAAHFLAVEELGAHPFGAGRFDLVLVLCTLHHMSDEVLERVLPELDRVLAPGGRLLVIEGMSADCHDSWLVWGMLKLDMGNHFRTPEQLRALLGRQFDLTEYREENSRGDGRGYRLPCFVLAKRRARTFVAAEAAAVAGR
jgi:SAM-dependent methyltransferase